MASKGIGQTLATRRCTKRAERKENDKEAILNLQTKGDAKKKYSNRQTKTKLDQRELHVPGQLTSQPTRRQTKTRGTVDEGSTTFRVKEKSRAPLARRESRILKVTTVNINNKKIDKECQKSTTNLKGQLRTTACTHPTTKAAAGVSKKTGTTMHPPARLGVIRQARVKKNTAPTSQKTVTTDISAVPDVVTVAVQCPADSVPDIHPVPDPDIGTETDPQLCAEYIKDIYKYLLDLEIRPIYTIKENFLSTQVDVGRHHRGVLVDWLVQVHQRFQLVPETLHLTVDILDRSLQVGSLFM